MFHKICPVPSVRRSVVLKMKKLLNDGERVNANIYQELLRQHVVPWVQMDIA
jgi:hypothetical protein